MDDSDDFTFCQVISYDQVASQVDDNHLESHRTISNIKDITIEDNNSNGVGIPKIADSTHDRSPHDTMELGSARPSSDTSNDMPPELKLKEPLMQNAGETTSSPIVPKEEKRTVKKPIVRAKVPFEKGYSQMDWLKLTRTHPDLAGLKGQSNRRPISMDEVRLHKSEGSIWTVLKGRVYNISPYMKFHPGGVDMLMKAAGNDSTSLFNKHHAWVNDEFLLEKCLVGVLDDSRS